MSSTDMDDHHGMQDMIYDRAHRVPAGVGMTHRLAKTFSKPQDHNDKQDKSKQCDQGFL